MNFKEKANGMSLVLSCPYGNALPTCPYGHLHEIKDKKQRVYKAMCILPYEWKAMLNAHELCCSLRRVDSQEFSLNDDWFSNLKDRS